MLTPVFTFPEGARRCVTFSYDDGRLDDRRLVEIFNQNKVKGTFHLNSGYLENDDKIGPEEISELYAGHEISCHMVRHPWPDALPREAIMQETVMDRKNLEEICGYPVRGMSYPFGNYSPETLAVLPQAGIEYSRTVKSTGQFSLPENPLLWHPTCHHKDWKKYADGFANNNRSLVLFYIWGHSYEFDRDGNWDLIEECCQTLAGRDDTWYATNIEIIDYLNACKSLRFSVGCSMVLNPSSQTVWFKPHQTGNLVSVNPGETLKIS